MNEQITAPEVRVIGPDGKQCGVLTIGEALQMARGLHMDVVEIVPSATPPIVRIVDLVSLRKEFKQRQDPPDFSNN